MLTHDFHTGPVPLTILPNKMPQLIKQGIFRAVIQRCGVSGRWSDEVAVSEAEYTRKKTQTTANFLHGAKNGRLGASDPFQKYFMIFF